VGPRSGFRVVATRAGGDLDSTVVSGLANGRLHWFKVIASGRGGRRLVVSNLVMTAPGPVWMPSRTVPLYVQDGFSWSPASDRIAYIDRSEPDRHDVSVLDLSSMTSTRVTRYPPDEVNLNDAEWSPDGGAIAYESSPLHGTDLADFRIWLVSLADGSTRPLTSGPVDWDAAWGGAGRLYFLRAPLGASRIEEIWRVDPGVPGSERAVTADQSHHKRAASARATDDRIVYSATSLSDTRPALRLLNPQTGAITPLTTGESWDDIAPDWEPDGRHVTFVSNASGHFEAWSIDVVSRSVTQLTRGPLGEPGVQTAKWSPDGRRLAVLAVAYPRQLRIYDAPAPLAAGTSRE
jgi:Tol biopolymer transport system component